MLYSFLEECSQGMTGISVLIAIIFCFAGSLIPRKIVAVFAVYFGFWTGIMTMGMFTTNFFVCCLAALVVPAGFLAAQFFVGERAIRFTMGFFAGQRTGFWLLSMPVFGLAGGCDSMETPTEWIVIASLVLGCVLGGWMAGDERKNIWWILMNVCIGAVMLGSIVGQDIAYSMPGSDYCCSMETTVDQITQTMHINAMDTENGFFVLFFGIVGMGLQCGIWWLRNRSRQPAI